MNYLKQVQQGIDHIEANLEADITPGMVARHAGISQWHFQRIFKALTNETLKAYIRARRLANSLEALLTTDLRIVDIAMSAGYDNQESYTRAFRQSFDMTPSAYRKIAKRAMFLKKVQIDEEYIRHIQSGISLEPVLQFRPTMTLVGLHTKFYSVDSDKNNVAQKLPALWQSFLPRLQEIQNIVGSDCYGALYRVEENDELLNYFCGIAVSDTSSLPEGMQVLSVPESQYAHFVHQGEVAQLDSTVNYVYSNWLMKSGFKHNYGPDLEIYGANYDPNSSESIIHYAIPVD